MASAADRFTRVETREQNAYFWQQYERFLVRIGEDRNSALFRTVRNRMVEFPQPGTQVDAVTRAETLAQEAASSSRRLDQSRARRLFEEALQARRQRDGENNLDLARARLRFARFLDSMRDHEGEYDERAIISQFELAANAFRQQSPLTLEGADVLRQLGQAYADYTHGSRLSEREACYREAAAIYGANASTRDNGAYARCLRELVASQFSNSHPQEAQTTLERLLELSGTEMPVSARVQVLTACLEGLRLSMTHGSSADAIRSRSTAVQLLARLAGINLSGVPREHSTALWSALWWLGRDMSENDSTRAQSYQFFDRSLDVLVAGRGTEDSEFQGSLRFYADLLRRHNLPERAQQVMNRANAPPSQIIATDRAGAVPVAGVR